MDDSDDRDAVDDSALTGEDLAAMGDPEFLALRRRVREEIERTPEDEVSPELMARFQWLDQEFLRRASIAWAQADN